MAKMGRPKIEIDWAQFEKLCRLRCTLDEVAGFFDCSPDTIERAVKQRFSQTFAEVHKAKSAHFNVSLRRKQAEVALKGNTQMLIWLGKQVLGQIDNTEIRFKREEEAVAQLTDEQLFQRAQAVLPELVRTIQAPSKPLEPGSDDED